MNGAQRDESGRKEIVGADVGSLRLVRNVITPPDLSSAVECRLHRHPSQITSAFYIQGMGKAIRTAGLKPGAICSKGLVRPRRARPFYASHATFTAPTSP